MLEPRTLDLGCGKSKLAGAVGMDVNPRSDADVIHDVDDIPWPFDNDTFEYIRAQDVLEHVRDFMAVMGELYRVAKPDAVVHVRMPFMTSPHAATDPTHRRACTSRTFDYFDAGKALSGYAYSPLRFEVSSVHYERGYPDNWLGRTLLRVDRVLVPWLERHKEEYEHFFAGVYPMHNVFFELRVLKS